MTYQQFHDILCYFYTFQLDYFKTLESYQGNFLFFALVVSDASLQNL